MSIKQTLNNIKDIVTFNIRAYAAPIIFIIVEVVIAIICIVKVGKLPTRWAFYFLLVGAILNLIALLKEDLQKNEEAERLEVWYKGFYVLFVFGDFLQRMLYTIFGVVN